MIGSVAEASKLVADHKRPAVLVIHRDFSYQVDRCSFLREGINPFHREGVYLDRVGVELISDASQPVAVGIIARCPQVTLMRVLLPWMIGRAFERLSDAEFINLLGRPSAGTRAAGEATMLLNEVLRMAAVNDRQEVAGVSGQGRRRDQSVAAGAVQQVQPDRQDVVVADPGRDSMVRDGAEDPYENRDGTGLLSRGALPLSGAGAVLHGDVRLLPGADGRLGLRDRTAAGNPETPAGGSADAVQILLGKLLPCFLLSLGQGCCCWWRASWCSACVGDRKLVAGRAGGCAAAGGGVDVAGGDGAGGAGGGGVRTEVQVALVGGIAVLVLALIGGCVLPREMMPEQAQFVSLFTPHGWALQAYRELLVPTGSQVPNSSLFGGACGVLSGFGLGFLALAWWLLRLE